MAGNHTPPDPQRPSSSRGRRGGLASDLHEPLAAASALPCQCIGVEGQAGTAIIGISSIHLLKTSINAAQHQPKVLIGQTGIHLAFLLSAIAIGYAERIVGVDERREVSH